MTNRANTAGQVISLPQGGGALSSIGETFSPDLHTGTGNFVVPIKLPLGRNDFQPDLKLVYSTGHGNGPFGLGWNLSVPGVSRKTSKGIPRYDDIQDTFLLSDAEDLVPVDRGGQTTRYQPRTEGLFAHITHHQNDGLDYWEVHSKDGLISFYGTRQKPEEAAEGWRDPAVIVDPLDYEHVFSWKLTETQDPFGNRILYHYQRDKRPTDDSILPPSGQLYLKKIQYVDYADEENEQDRFFITIRFDYEQRPDRFSDGRPGFIMRTNKRCQRIVITAHPDNQELARHYLTDPTDPDLKDHILVRTYELRYKNQALNNVSLLKTIQVTGHDEAAAAPPQLLPPLTFDYTKFEPDKRQFAAVKGQLPAVSLAAPHTELADLFGNGLPDILQMNGTVRYWRNLGHGRFDRLRTMQQAPAGHALDNLGVQLLDANGNGRVDLLITANGVSGYYPLTFNGEWDRDAFQKYETAPSFNLAGPEVQLVDLNGNGITDAIRSGTRFDYFYNDPQQGWQEPEQAPRQELDQFPNVNFSDRRVHWGDMNGDGLQDIVLLHNGRVDYWPNLGHGRWGSRVTMSHSPRFPDHFDPRRILIGDVDGDGAADLLYIEDNHITLHINQSGYSWSKPVQIKGTPSVTDMDAVRLIDLHGQGVKGLLWSTNASRQNREQMYFLDFTGGRKPYLLNEMNNHMGALTKVEYLSSTHFYEQDAQDPQTRWRTPLPFPVQVVARVEIIDQLSGVKLTSGYRYHHGYWDGSEREFRGFGLVEQLDSERFEYYSEPGLHDDLPFEAVADKQRFSPPTLKKIWFHQGPVGEEQSDWRELDRSVDYWPGDPQLLAHTEQVNRFLQTLPTRRTRRDALRTLRGRPLRTELYALDGSEREERPYTVTEHAYGLRTEEKAEHQHIFFPHRLATRTTQWERGDDPLTRFQFTNDYDGYGQPQQHIQIACPRGWHPADNGRSQDYLTTVSETTFARRDDGECYMVDRTASETRYEVKMADDQSLTVFELWNAIRERNVTRQVIGQTLNFYDGDPFTGLPLGQLGNFGAPVRTEILTLTEDILRQAYDDTPPYLQLDSDTAGSDDYPRLFREPLPDLAGYTFQTAAGVREKGYFVQKSRRQYDFQTADGDEAPQPRGLVSATKDPLGNRTGIKHDRFQLLPTEVINPADLTTHAAYDYRAFKPRLITDPNANRRAFGYTPLGLLASKMVMGKEGEEAGDTLKQPSTRFDYDLLAFEQGQPVSVRTIRRVHHINESDAPFAERDETIETVEYSDGFGRLIQTRTQAEDTLFGSDVFGGGALPADLSVTPGESIGKTREPDQPPNVVVSGWQVYDNKGQVIEKYEPFFSRGLTYAPPVEVERGQKTTLVFDPRGQVIRTINPDGSQKRVIYGIPHDLAQPTNFTPTPWEAYNYDANDNAGRTHDQKSNVAHLNTPSSIVIDPLGRTIAKTERNGPDPAKDWFITHSTYDIRGNLLTVIDPLGRTALRYTYDLRPTNDNEEEENTPRLRMEQLDAGVEKTIYDAARNPIEQRDSKGALILHSYDTLRRPTHRWARDDEDESSVVTLRQRLIYGDSPAASLSTEGAQSRNLLGRLYQHYDEAGRLTFEEYDFKSNVLEKVRQTIADETILAVFPEGDDPPPEDWHIIPFRVDWQPPPDTTLANHAAALLETQTQRTTNSYDALNRFKSVTYPEDVTGQRRLLRPVYNRAGDLQQVTVDGECFVDHIAYNARGQRTLITRGNGIMTRYAYDAETFRLSRLRSEAYTTPAEAPFTFQPISPQSPLQDIGYTYDLMGNVRRIEKRTPGSGIKDNPDSVAVDDPQLSNLLAAGDALLRHFTYDPLYRLISATGRECKAISQPRPWNDEPRCGFGSGNHGMPNQANAPNLTRPYRETYRYDPAGNLLTMSHRHNGSGWSRHFGLGGRTPSRWQDEWLQHLDGEPWPEPPSNRLTHVGDDDPAAPQTHFYDANGNLVRETSSRHFAWDHSDWLKAFWQQTGEAEPSVYVHYLYDAGGQRVKKLVRKQGGRVETTTYIGAIFERHRWQENGQPKQNNRLHIMDDSQRVALLRVGSAHPKDQGPATQYHLADHLGSSNLIVDGQGAFINREEYTPYGETSLGSFGRKRYRFTGQERDEESGLYYHGARYYAPWLTRWISCDPAGPVSSLNLYRYGQSNPLRFIDPEGTQDREVIYDQESGMAIEVQGQGKFEMRKCLDYDPTPTLAKRPSEFRFPNIQMKQGFEAHQKALQAWFAYQEQKDFHKTYRELHDAAKNAEFDIAEGIVFQKNFLQVLTEETAKQIRGEIKGEMIKKIAGARIAAVVGVVEMMNTIRKDIKRQNLYNMADRSLDDDRFEKALDAAIEIMAEDRNKDPVDLRRQYEQFESAWKEYDSYRALEQSLDPANQTNSRAYTKPR